MSHIPRDNLCIISIIHTDSAAVTLMNQSFEPADKYGFELSPEVCWHLLRSADTLYVSLSLSLLPDCSSKMSTV